MTRIHSNEVVTRDGFQIEAEFIDTDTTVAWLESCAEALNLVMSTSETHYLVNLGMSREKSPAGLHDVITLAAVAGLRGAPA